MITFQQKAANIAVFLERTCGFEAVVTEKSSTLGDERMGDCAGWEFPGR
jgi:hypothetical protein